ncbi:hypothetical protein EHS13_11370 [Paenibacillus psychroresistens]|uniref:Glycosyl hydrolase family 43 n=1 Tax=Paenibacillus psychroresistens TaxID=1778678 RepID=A0A6B8RH73_9BACL|nr:hypothetical protein [Paenibacillus psychroresistens]QGQ95439.1 hypothetical protein EHS13_11370 [Paenibacillus psychroresistens]
MTKKGYKWLGGTLFFFLILLTMASSVFASNVLKDDFSNIAGWDKQGVVVNLTQAWEGSMLQDPSVLYNQGGGALFKMWYGASGGGIGYASSNDGVTWTKYAGNPILANGPNGAIDDGATTVPSVVYKDGIYHMTYMIHDNQVARIAYAYATNPQGPWTKFGAILSPTLAWEDNFLYNTSLMYDSDNGIWKMWYTAGKIASAGGEPEFICYATATSITGPWTKYSGNPLISPMADGRI